MIWISYPVCVLGFAYFIWLPVHQGNRQDWYVVIYFMVINTYMNKCEKLYQRPNQDEWLIASDREYL